MDAKPLLCPSCGGQIKLHGDLFNEKITKCEFCGTLIDLHQEASRQEFDINDFFKNFQNVSTTVSTNTIVMKNGKIISENPQDADKILKSVQEQLKNSGINIDGLKQAQQTTPKEDIINTDDITKTQAKPPQKGFWKKMFGG